MAERVLAATQVGARKMELREYPMPEICPDDALLKMEVAGICGSDIGGYQEFEGAPRIRGHENVGFLAKIGANAAQR
jgi:D-arabinose 1-dehydrogenase-like Zn-dependent alcohol dehydrogenase